MRLRLSDTGIVHERFARVQRNVLGQPRQSVSGLAITPDSGVRGWVIGCWGGFGSVELAALATAMTQPWR